MVLRKPVPAPAGTVPPHPTAPPPPPPLYASNEHMTPEQVAWSSPPEPTEPRETEDGPDWWDDSDDDNEPPIILSDSVPAHNVQARLGPEQGNTANNNQLPTSLQAGISSGAGRVSPGKTKTFGDVGMANLSVMGSGSSHLPNESHTNPFLRPRSQEPQADIESTAAIWREDRPPNNKLAPQIPMPYFSREPLSPEMFGEPANGQMTRPGLINNQIQPGPKMPVADLSPLIDLEPEDPWKDSRSMSGNSTAAATNAKNIIIPRNISDFDYQPLIPAGDFGRILPNNSTTSATRGQLPTPKVIPPLNVNPSQPIGRPEVETPQTTARKQRNESYQIKHIRWHDANSHENTRYSPILIQNANGPCPLLALVNALVLSTPPTIITPLLETLRTREQITLGLLLDAVFDELMSDRRRGSAQDLPDVGDLYSFLVTLHTGMNVNPRFVPAESIMSEAEKPGSFQETREMLLYSTFSVPLIHGWLPQRNDDAFSAFQRLAPTYEDAQNMQFRELELEHKLQSIQLTDEEETLYIDLTTIREFISLWPTQLTDFGLGTIKQSLKPGEVAILFRNDHFSTIYKQPRSGQLMTLVTDAGYATHDEIVWESLVDINGSNSELFAGDFKSVSHHQPSNSAQHADAGLGFEGEWTTVENKNSRNRRQVGKSAAGDQATSTSSGFAAAPEPVALQRQPTASVPATKAGSTSPSPSPPPQPRRPRTTSEQEDHDLALALQLQEEEEQRSRADERRREDELSARYLDQESSRRGPQPTAQPHPEVRPEIPVRRSNVANASSTQTTASTPIRNVVTSRSEDVNGDEAPPPPYEQATAKGSRPYIPPQQPLPPAQSPTSLYGQSSQAYGGPTAQLPARGGGRRRLSGRPGSLVNQIPEGNGTGRGRGGAVGVGGKGTDESDERCIVM